VHRIDAMIQNEIKWISAEILRNRIHKCRASDANVRRGQLVAWHCPALDLYLTGDYLCGQTVHYTSINLTNSGFHPFEVDT